MHMSTRIILNGKQIQLPDDVSNITQLLKWRGIPAMGTAVAINSNVIPAARPASTPLADLDIVTIISAAYGG